MQNSPCLTFDLRRHKDKETNTKMYIYDRRLNNYYRADKKIDDSYKIAEL